MPGNTLRDAERKLGERWRNQPNSYPHTTLRKLSVDAAEDTSGLRGVKSLDVEFRYPVTVFVGKNGTGKSTLLALAALAFHSPRGYRPPGLQRRIGTGTAWTTFSDFFHRGPGDPDSTGVKLTWVFGDGEERSLVKKTHKWMHYERRPIRPIVYLGAGRVVPAIEQRVLRSYFSEKTSSIGLPLEPSALADVERVLGRSYGLAETLESRGRRYRVRRFNGKLKYSSFNMGAGEDVVFELIQQLHAAPDGSLVVIEEVELSLHPEAAQGLAEVLVDIAYSKSLQVICSSHSREFLEALPKEARVLLQRSGSHIDCFYGPTLGLAFGSISGKYDRDVVIYCEDPFASALLQRSLRSPTRNRAHLVPVGGKTEIAKAAAAHFRDGQPQKVILAWDGDVTASEVERYVEGLTQKYHVLELPGTEPPEAHVIARVSESDSGRAALAKALPEEVAVVDALLERLEVIEDPHRLIYAAAEFLSLPRQTVEQAFLQAYEAASPDEMQAIATFIEKVLESGG